MNDPKLYEALHGCSGYKDSNRNSPTQTLEKNRFELALDETLKAYVTDLLKNDDPTKISLIPPAIRQAQLIKELKESVDFSEFGSFLEVAVNIFRDEGQSYLGQDDYNTLVKELENLRNQLVTLDLSHLEDFSLKNALKIPAQTRAFMLKMGIAKFSEELYPASLSIFSFLSAVENDEPDYWYRLGLVAQESERYDLAIKSYQAAAELAPDFIGTKIFTAQCYLNLGEREKALETMVDVKDMMYKTDDSEKWTPHVLAIDNLLAIL